MDWLVELLDDLPDLPVIERHRPYWSQRKVAAATAVETSWPVIVARVRSLLKELIASDYYARTFGFSGSDLDDSYTSPQIELDERLGKAHLWGASDDAWSEDDLCDVIEVFHVLVARPTGGLQHGRMWQPTFSRTGGQAVFRWRINQLLAMTNWPMRIAEDGEDVGRMTRAVPAGIADLVHEAVTSSTGPAQDDVTHAVALFRSRSSSRSDQRSAVIALVGVLEQRKRLLEDTLLSGDESALRHIANKFDLRHRRADQRPDYDEAYLEWIFYWYLATVHLTNRLIDRQGAAPPA